MARNQVLRIINNWEDEGYTNQDYNVVYVNIEHLWKHSKNENEFIHKFSDVLTHEHLHCLINDILCNQKRTHYGEEKMIRKLLNESFCTAEKTIYRNFGRVK